MPKKFGWVDDPRAVEQVVSALPHPMFAYIDEAVEETGKGKVALMWLAVKRVLGTHLPALTQAIGDCVSFGYAAGVDYLTCVEIAFRNEPEKWAGRCATEPIYAGSRVEVGNGRLGNQDGSIGAWGAQCVSDRIGTLLRKKYGSHDLTTYSGQRAKAWGAPGAGVPDEIEPAARLHPVRTVSLVTTYEEARDAIANGYPIPVCSYQGFNEKRDSDGFLKPQGEWAHCMVFVGLDDAHSRPGLCCLNSWGPSWVTGPTRHDQPDGSFWVDADTVNKMLGQKDSFALSNYAGYPKRKYQLY